jgi:hypothetical protein
MPLLLLVQSNSDQKGFDEFCIGVNQSEREINHSFLFSCGAKKA